MVFGWSLFIFRPLKLQLQTDVWMGTLPPSFPAEEKINNQPRLMISFEQTPKHLRQ